MNAQHMNWRWHIYRHSCDSICENRIKTFYWRRPNHMAMDMFTDCQWHESHDHTPSNTQQMNGWGIDDVQTHIPPFWKIYSKEWNVEVRNSKVFSPWVRERQPKRDCAKNSNRKWYPMSNNNFICSISLMMSNTIYGLSVTNNIYFVWRMRLCVETIDNWNSPRRWTVA